MNSISSFTSNPADCTVSGWIAPGHAFVDFNCGKAMSETIGFYPVDEEYLDSVTDSDFPFRKFGGGSLGLVVDSMLCWHAGRFVHSIPGGKSSFFSSAASQAAGATFSIGNLLWDGGTFRDDRDQLEDCLSGAVPCMVKHFNVTHQAAERAWKLKLSDRPDFAIFGNNCVDFMLDVQRILGDSNPKEGFSYTYTPTFTDKIRAIAWHYFNWT